MESLTAIVFGYALTIVICNLEACEIIKDPKIYKTEKECWKESYNISLLVDKVNENGLSKVLPKVMNIDCSGIEFDKT